MYWFVFIAVFLSLCAREGKRTTRGDIFSRFARWLYEFGSRNAKKEESDEGAEKEG